MSETNGKPHGKRYGPPRPTAARRAVAPALGLDPDGAPPAKGTPPWDRYVAALEGHYGHPVCAARKSTDKWPCERAPMLNGRCHRHGGASLRGRAAAGFRHGRYSRDLPTRLVARYERALADPDLLSLTDEVALVDARIGELSERLTAGASAERWADAGRLAEQFRAALTRGGDRERLATLADQLINLTRAARDEERTWRDVHRTVERRRQLVETERKLLADRGQFLTAAEALTAAAALRDILLRYVPEPETLRRALYDLRQIFGEDADDPPGRALPAPADQPKATEE